MADNRQIFRRITWRFDLKSAAQEKEDDDTDISSVRRDLVRALADNGIYLTGMSLASSNKKVVDVIYSEGEEEDEDEYTISMNGKEQKFSWVSMSIMEFLNQQEGVSVVKETKTVIADRKSPVERYTETFGAIGIEKLFTLHHPNGTESIPEQYSDSIQDTVIEIAAAELLDLNTEDGEVLVKFRSFRWNHDKYSGKDVFEFQIWGSTERAIKSDTVQSALRAFYKGVSSACESAGVEPPKPDCKANMTASKTLECDISYLWEEA